MTISSPSHGHLLSPPWVPPADVPVPLCANLHTFHPNLATQAYVGPGSGSVQLSSITYLVNICGNQNPTSLQVWMEEV